MTLIAQQQLESYLWGAAVLLRGTINARDHKRLIFPLLFYRRLGDVIEGKLRFQEGDIIFGRRRAYQRNLAVAEFDGIRSARAMVIRARPDKVLPEILPFFMMIARFISHAVKNSIGSLSPSINRSTPKMENIHLPPFDQHQRKN